MSYALLNNALAQPLPPARRAVLLTLADMANHAGLCWPSIATIARKCCLSVRSIFTHLKALEAAGLLQRRARSGRSSLYSLSGLAADHMAASVAPDDAPQTVSDRQASSHNGPAQAQPHVHSQDSALSVQTAVAAMRAAGLVGAYECRTLADLAATASSVEEFTEAASRAVKRRKGYAWALARVAARRKQPNLCGEEIHPTTQSTGWPSHGTKDPALLRIEQDAARAAPLPMAIRERLAQLRATLMGAAPGGTV